MKNRGILLLVLVSLSFSLPPDSEISKALEKDPLFEKQMLFEGGRFPNVVVAKNGTVVTTWGKEKCVSRRSVDGGATWQSEVNIGSGINGGGLTVDENSGQLINFVEKGEHPPAPIRSYFSSDQGQS